MFFILFNFFVLFSYLFIFFFFFFQAEDGIRDWSVTGVQTCALPISARIEGGNTQGERRGLAERVAHGRSLPAGGAGAARQSARRRRTGEGAGRQTPRRLAGRAQGGEAVAGKIGRASCRERV